MPDQNETQRPKKSTYLVVLCVIIVILALSATFFFTDNIFYGIILIAVPALSLLIGAGCYIAHKSQPSFSDVGAVGQTNQSQNGANGGLSDRPPTYRQTWRRSFMNRMKNIRSSNNPGNSSNMATIEEGGGEAAIEIIFSRPLSSVDEVPTTSAEINQPTNDAELPSYDEALEITRSRENLAS